MKSLYGLHTLLGETFRSLLEDDLQGRSAREQIRAMGISDTTSQDFSLGFAPADRFWLHGFLVSQGYSDETLGQSSLFSRKAT